MAPKLEGGSGGGLGVPPPRPPPRRASACHPLSPACPPGVCSRRGGCRAAAGVGRGPVGRRQASAAGGGGDPPPWFAPPLLGPLRLRRRPAAGRACGRRPRPWCPRTPGAAASPGGMRGCRFFGLPPSAFGPEWEGGGGGGGPLVPWRRLLTAGGGGGMASPAPGASHRLGGRTLPPPPST